ncbi:unnamed protein product, partial [Orchesella dallaii]
MNFERPYAGFQALLQGPLTMWRFADVIHSEEDAVATFVDWGLIPVFRNCPNCSRSMGGRVMKRLSDSDHNLGFR